MLLETQMQLSATKGVMTVAHNSARKRIVRKESFSLPAKSSDLTIITFFVGIKELIIEFL